jgi:hypothetical protein
MITIGRYFPMDACMFMSLNLPNVLSVFMILLSGPKIWKMADVSLPDQGKIVGGGLSPAIINHSSNTILITAVVSAFLVYPNNQVVDLYQYRIFSLSIVSPGQIN